MVEGQVECLWQLLGMDASTWWHAAVLFSMQGPGRWRNSATMLPASTFALPTHPAGVDDLDLTVAGKGLGVGRQAGSVPAVVAGELACSGRQDGHKSQAGLGLG